MHSYQYEILLTKKEYETISADFGNEAKRVLQIDFFYDTPELFLDRPPESSGNIPMSVKEQAGDDPAAAGPGGSALSQRNVLYG